MIETVVTQNNNASASTCAIAQHRRGRGARAAHSLPETMLVHTARGRGAPNVRGAVCTLFLVSKVKSIKAAFWANDSFDKKKGDDTTQYKRTELRQRDLGKVWVLAPFL